MKVDVLNEQGEKVSSAELPASIFEVQVKPDLMHQALTRQLANARAGTHKTKTRSEVRGGGRKPWRQKGTGRARHGSIRSPIWVGGGGVHTPRPRSYAVRMPRKMRRAALRSALSAKAGEQQITVVEALELVEPKTGAMSELLARWNAGEGAVLVLPEANPNVEKAARNLPQVKTLRANYLNVRDLLNYERVIIPLQALEIIAAYLDPEVSQ